MTSAPPRAPGPQLHSPRLLLRRWRAEDLQPFAAMNADPEVMEHFPATLSAAQTAELVERIEVCFQVDGYGLWAVELLGEGSLAGMVGLLRADEALPFAPALEVGWRLARPFWGRGIACEAASVAADFAFQQLAVGDLLAYTATQNTRSRRVMERLGMSRDPAEDFDHPQLAPGHRLARHVVYRVDAATWRARANGRPVGSS